jgi:Zn-dependent protease
MDVAALIQAISISALPVIFAITLHEAAHGYAAWYFGDTTARAAGRISLNPLRHIDPIGTLLVPGAILVLSYLTAGSALLFGWAKPVPVNFGRLRRPKRDMVWVAAAGPLVNLLMALGWAALLKLAMVLPYTTYTRPLGMMCMAGININLVLMALNLLPYRLAVPFSRLERWGFPILLLLLFTDTLDWIIGPVFVTLRRLIFLFFRLI